MTWASISHGTVGDLFEFLSITPFDSAADGSGNLELKDYSYKERSLQQIFIKRIVHTVLCCIFIRSKTVTTSFNISRIVKSVEI